MNLPAHNDIEFKRFSYLGRLMVRLSHLGNRTPRWLAYVGALAILGIGIGVRYPLWPILDNRVPYLTFFPVVVFVALMFGRRPAYVAALGSAAFAWYALLPPVYSWANRWFESSMATALFLFVSLMVIVMVELIAAANAALFEREQRLERAAEQARLLAREMDHRVKNVFGVIVSIIKMSLRGKSDIAAAQDKIVERILALSRAHDVSQGKAVSDERELRDIIAKTLAPYADFSARLDIAGDDALVPLRAVTPLGLIVHELATNAIKFGAWAGEQGRVEISWSDASGDVPRLDFFWIETEVASGDGDRKPGFGSRLLDTAARQLGASIERGWTPDGMRVRFSIPRGNPEFDEELSENVSAMEL